jgi:hypothetical protein
MTELHVCKSSDFSQKCFIDSHVILDFGVATQLSEIEAEANYGGTPYWSNLLF